jgi:hypothetical protein
MKLPWYMKAKEKGTVIEFHWLWVKWQKLKAFIRLTKASKA